MKKILFIKSLTNIYTTEQVALDVLNNPVYDDNPLINKGSIERAFELYGEKLNPLNKNSIPAITDINLNIEGNFIAVNIPEIESVVINQTCTKESLHNLIAKHDDVTHIALSTYAIGMKNTIELIGTLQKEYSHIILYVGGIGAVYSQLQKIVPPTDLCIGEGVNFLRSKFGLSPLTRRDFKIPIIYGNNTNLPVSIKTAYMVTQLGCPYKCDFCITPNFYDYFPFSDALKIISFFENLINTRQKEIFVYLCDPNGFYPEKTWKKVFDYFIENRNNYDKQVFITVLASLEHINKFDLERIQKFSTIKLFGINYGIESTLYGGYMKNKNISQEVINRLNENGIIGFHTCIIGLPIHTKENIHVDIKNNCKMNSDIVSFNTFKPIPRTQIFKELEAQKRLFLDQVPHDFLYMEGYLPFNHPNLGFGFDILPYTFEAYYESELKLIDYYSNIADKLVTLHAISNSKKIKNAIWTLINLSQQNFESFSIRMPSSLSEQYQSKLIQIKSKIQKY
ncbi:MAG: radical SAM protein [Candidatus Lokiarchaeota archaeon]|nr:radical SAM protein [Candidatus Lokiarchaeota archaeon]